MLSQTEHGTKVVHLPEMNVATFDTIEIFLTCVTWKSHRHLRQLHALLHLAENRLVVPPLPLRRVRTLHTTF